MNLNLVYIFIRFSATLSYDETSSDITLLLENIVVLTVPILSAFYCCVMMKHLNPSSPIHGTQDIKML